MVAVPGTIRMCLVGVLAHHSERGDFGVEPRTKHEIANCSQII